LAPEARFPGAPGVTRTGRIDHTGRAGGFDGSTSARLTGPTPQIAMIAGPLWPRITPS